MHNQQNLLANLPGSLQSVLVQVARLAREQNLTIWLAGGVVRDLLLGRSPDYDLDLVIEGNTADLARALAVALNGKITATYPPFGTATVAVPLLSDQGVCTTLSLDLAMARTETYAHPAALPAVQPATLIQDLARRDFSLNAMAVEVLVQADQLVAGTLLDPAGGQPDLARGMLRVLHDKSFDDDPTRILRGLRLATRLDLHFEPHTHALLSDALSQKRLEATSPDRVRTELCLALAEPRPEAVLRLADTLGITPHIFATLCWSASIAARCEYARHVTDLSTPVDPLIYAGLLTYDLTAAQRQQLAQRYRLPNDAARLLQETGAIQALRPALAEPSIRHSELDNLLRPFSPVSLELARLSEPAPISTHISCYLIHLRHIKPILNGHALQQLGIPPGPPMGQLLAALRAARLDGLVTTRADEEAWVVAQIKKSQPEQDA